MQARTLAFSFLLSPLFIPNQPWSIRVPAQQAVRRPKVEITIVKVERKDAEISTVQWEIVNRRDRPILFPKAIASFGIYTVEIDTNSKTGWTTLPIDREWLHYDSDPIIMGSGETYRYNWNLSNNYMLPMWVTFPKPRYSIPLDTELRLNITYFEEPDDWEAYLAELNAGKRHWGRMETLLRKWGRQAYSPPFRLPSAKPPGAPQVPQEPPKSR